jgi:uncharacterized protein involved in exopolysaccharide biosynthesis
MSAPSVRTDAATLSELSISDLLRAARRGYRVVLAWSVSGLLLGYAIALTLPNYYRAKAMLSPSGEDMKPSAALSALGSFGIQLGGPSKIEDLEVLLHSEDLTSRVFATGRYWSEVFGSRYDGKTNTLHRSLQDFLTGREARAPNDWDAIRAAESALHVSVNKKSGTLQITFESLSAEGSAALVTAYIEGARDRLVDEALERARKNKNFLQDQIEHTSDALARERLFSLLGQELEKEMMAKNRNQLGFKIIDRPRVPEKKAGPPRTLVALASAILAAALATVFLALRKPARAERGDGAG